MGRAKAKTLGQLRKSGYEVVSIREEMRRNLIDKVRKSEDLFPGIVGYEGTVIPQIQNAILAGQDVIFLGERGQAKSRLIRSLVNLLDDEIPFVAGCEINDHPYKPICRQCRDKAEKHGDDLEIDWLPREARYGEKLATPDTTIADLIGEVDPIRVAEGRYLADEMTIHYGLIPRTNRGIFCINELPDLAERIQVGLFNILEERDVQIRGYKVRLPLDVYLVASANPEDYTSRGRIITPLKDRYGSQIRTHYPRTAEHEIAIMEAERAAFKDAGVAISVPAFMKEIVAELTAQARRSPDINQRSGVSVRVSIANYEVLTSNALRRAIRLGEKEAVPRISDLPYLMASTAGKIEMETVDEGREDKVLEKLIHNAVATVFDRRLSAADFADLIERFAQGATVEVSENTPSARYAALVQEMGGLEAGLAKLKDRESPAYIASAVEFILEGLHLRKKLNKDKVAGRSVYRV